MKEKTENLEEFVRCRVCLLRWWEVIVDCGHTYCMRCLIDVEKLEERNVQYVETKSRVSL